MSNDGETLQEGTLDGGASSVDEARGAVEETASKLRESATSGLSAARDKFQGIASDAKDRYSRASTGIKEGAGRASEVARERYQQVSERARVGYEKARKDIDDLSENVNEYVRDNPGKSVLIAAGLGFAVGLLLRGRRRD